MIIKLGSLKEVHDITSQKWGECFNYKEYSALVYLIKNNSFLFLKIFTNLITASYSIHWTFDPKDTTISPCSAAWTKSSISEKKIYVAFFIHVCMYVMWKESPFGRGLASSTERPSTEITFGNKGFGWSKVRSAFVMITSCASSKMSNHPRILSDTIPK